MAANAEAAAGPQPGKVSYKQSQSSAGIPATFKQMVQKSVDQREAFATAPTSHHPPPLTLTLTLT